MTGGPVTGLLRGLRRLENSLLVLFFCLLLGLTVTQIALRLFFGTGLSWADSLIRLLVIWTGFMGAVAASRDNRHIVIDLVRYLAPARLRPVLARTTAVLAMLVCLVLAMVALRFVRDEAMYGGRTLAGLPSWLQMAILPVAFALMAVHFLAAATGRSDTQ